MNHASPSLKHRRGFTLIELMIAVVIVAILAAVAIPSYQQYVIRGKRAAAQAQMLDIANRQQQYFLDKRTYATKAQLQDFYSLPSDVAASYTYDIELTTSGLPGYTITFSPTGSQSSDGALTLNSAGVKEPASKW